jgi:hypothetical protein
MNIETGKTYNFFDDGKVKESRRYECKITEIIPFEKASNKLVKKWQKEVERCYWLYDKTTDFFIRAVSDEIDEEQIFVRSKGGWFSLGFWAGRLDYDGSLYQQMLNYEL